MQKTNKIRNFVLIFIVFTLITSFVSANNIIRIDSVYTKEKQDALSSFFSFLAITLNKDVYTIGESISYKSSLDFTPSPTTCPNLYIILRFYKEPNILISTNSKIAGTSSPGIYEVSGSISTSSLSAGSYTLITDWYCSQSQSSGGSLLLSYSKSLTINKPTNTNTTPDAQICKKTCNLGYELIDPNSVGCFCQAKFVYSNGICEIGEKEASPSTIDCQTISSNTCPTSDSIYVNGVCTKLSDICIENGGTKVCNVQNISNPDNTNTNTNNNQTNEVIPNDPTSDNNNSLIIIVFLIAAIIGGYFIVTKR